MPPIRRHTTTRAAGRFGSCRGQSLIESVFVLLTLLAMILFIVDMGRIMLTEQYLMERARAAARMAAVNNWTQADVANYVAYNSTRAPAGGNTTPGLMGVLPSKVSYTPPTTACDPSCYVKVTIAGVTAFTVVPYMAGRYTLPTITVSLPAGSLGATN
ncbi:MAG TPA: TadE/TadG family type IV pilus assembly protein [Bryobacteraceae bacterium]